MGLGTSEQANLDLILTAIGDQRLTAVEVRDRLIATLPDDDPTILAFKGGAYFAPGYLLKLCHGSGGQLRAWADGVTSLGELRFGAG